MAKHHSAGNARSTSSVSASGGRIAISTVTTTSRTTVTVPEPTKPRAHDLTGRGVNLAGLEFGADMSKNFHNANPGLLAGHGPNPTHVANSERTYAYFASKGIRVFRVPIRWERIQPTLSGPLDPLQLSVLKEQARFAKLCSSKIIIDVHNYGAYWLKDPVNITESGIDSGGSVKAGHLVDLWIRLSQEFKNDDAVDAYGLMNEPHLAKSWQSVSQLVVNEIRKNKDRKLLLVSGSRFASAHTWLVDNGDKPWINDPDGNTVYETHCYFDADNSGTYKQTFDQEYLWDQRIEFRGQQRLSPFVKWCRDNNVRGFVGEYGIPNNEPRWLPVLDKFLDTLSIEGMSSCYWAAGEWWGDYVLSIQPTMDFRQSQPPFDHLIGRR